jgi:uncharacterized protein
MEEDIRSSVFHFPCAFPLKVFGEVTDDFEDMVLGIISRHVEELETGTVSSRLSSGGKYLCVTVTIDAQSKDQLDNLYMDLSSHERVLMLL